MGLDLPVSDTKIGYCTISPASASNAMTFGASATRNKRMSLLTNKGNSALATFGRGRLSPAHIQLICSWKIGTRHYSFKWTHYPPAAAGNSPLHLGSHLTCSTIPILSNAFKYSTTISNVTGPYSAETASRISCAFRFPSAKFNTSYAYSSPLPHNPSYLSSFGVTTPAAFACSAK